MLKDAFLQSLERPYKKHLKCILPKLLMKMNFFDVNVFSKMYKRHLLEDPTGRDSVKCVIALFNASKNAS